MNQKIFGLNKEKYQINKNENDNNQIFDIFSLNDKNVSNKIHNVSSLFKVIQDEKESHQLNINDIYKNETDNKIINSDKSSPIRYNIIKPKFITRTKFNENFMKNNDENQSVNSHSLSLNYSSYTFQPKIILNDNDDKNENELDIENENKNISKCLIIRNNEKVFNLILEINDNILIFKIYEVNSNIYLLKYFYENSFTINDLRQLHKFFFLFDNVYDALKELEKIFIKEKYIIYEDLDNKKINLQIKVLLLEREENITFEVFQKLYTKDILFETLCQKVGFMSQEYKSKLNKLEEENKYLRMYYYQISNSFNPMNINYQLNQKENYNPKNNIFNNSYNSTFNNSFNNSFNNNININKNISLINNYKNNSNNKNNKEDKYNIFGCENYNNENINNNEENDIEDDEKMINYNERLNKKRKRRKSSNDINKNYYSNINKNIEIKRDNNTNDNISNDNNYYFLKDIKLKRVKCKGLYDIIQTEEELQMIINKILLKYKKENNISNYEYKLQFYLNLLFDSSINGDLASEFHKKCDYKNNTISIIETTNDHRFGGYTKECFESPDEYFDKKDNLSFLFSFDKMKTYDVIKEKYAISCDKNYGPYFRDDHICIVDNFLSNQSGTCIKGKNFYTSKNYELNLGRKYFTVKRLQVFQIKIKKIK